MNESSQKDKLVSELGAQMPPRNKLISKVKILNEKKYKRFKPTHRCPMHLLIKKFDRVWTDALWLVILKKQIIVGNWLGEPGASYKC